ncbi:MAG: hypothetical protein WD773_07650 [Gemmatimonadales bacterium]
MARKFTYDAFVFRQRDNAPLQASFVASSSDIDSWARVPTKRAGNIRNFQRAEVPQHVSEVMSFFQDEGQENASPTAVVIGFDPIRSPGHVELVGKDGKALAQADVPPGPPIPGKLTITIEDAPDPKNKNDYVKTIVSHQKSLRQYVFEELRQITLLTPDQLKFLLAEFEERAKQGKPTISAEDAEDDAESDAESEAAADENEEEEKTTKVAALSDKAREALTGLSPSEQQIVVGRLEFLGGLQESILAKTSEEVLKQICREVEDEVKPGLLIDGQHRIMGTKGLPSIHFLVCALPGAPWPELAFQFIVTNHTAKRVQESLLINIVGNSLSKAQRAAIEDRLRDSGIKVGLIEAVMKVHEEEVSPFYGLLAFGLKEEKGFLDAAAMRNKVIQLWYDRKPFKDLTTSERVNPVIDLFDHFTEGKLKSDRTDSWKSSDKWFEFFIAFWDAVRTRYEGSDVFSSELVEQGKKTPVKTPVSKLMTATVLKVFQETILANVARYLHQKEQKDGTPVAQSIKNSEAFAELVANTLKPLTPEFFQGWTITGFDGSKGARVDLAEAILLVVEQGKTPSALKKMPHRLFKETAA